MTPYVKVSFVSFFGCPVSPGEKNGDAMMLCVYYSRSG